MAKLSDVIVGGPVIFSPSVLGEVLRGSCFYMSYDAEEQSLEFYHNNNSGGRTIFVIKNISHESAKKLAEGVGLKAYKDDASATSWSKSIPIINLFHDGSAEAERIRLEACRLNMECKVSRTEGKSWELYGASFRYTPDCWPVEKVIKEMEKWAQQWGLKSYLREEKVSA